MELTNIEIDLQEVESRVVDIQRILVEDGPTAHIDFVVYLVQAQYQRYIKSIQKVDGPDVPREMMNRALIYSKWRTLEWLLQEGQGLIERSTAWLLDEATRVGWFHSDYFGWKDLEEMLATAVNAQEEGSSAYYDWLVFTNKIVPAAKKFDVDPGMLMSSATQIKKMRHQLLHAYNELEQKMKIGQITPEEGQEIFKWMMGLAADPKISNSRMKEELDAWRGIIYNQPPVMDGYVVIMPDGGEIRIIKTPEPVFGRVIDNALRNKVNLTTVGMKTLIELVTDWMMITQEVK
jgi:hypothetical protein